MGFREFKKSGGLLAVVFLLIVVLLPFGVEQVGETTGLYKFQVIKTVKGWFAAPVPTKSAVATAAPVDWDRYRHDLKKLADYMNSQPDLAITNLIVEQVQPTNAAPQIVRALRIWRVPVSSCTAGDPFGAQKGSFSIAGFGGFFAEGSVIEPSEKLCGYETIFIGERSVWFRVVDAVSVQNLMGAVRFPEFTRIDGEFLLRGNRAYGENYRFPLTMSGGSLAIDSFLEPDGVIFKILDEQNQEIATILCIVIGEKGGK